MPGSPHVAPWPMNSQPLFRDSNPVTWFQALAFPHDRYNPGFSSTTEDLPSCLSWPFIVWSLSAFQDHFMSSKKVPGERFLHITKFGCQYEVQTCPLQDHSFCVWNLREHFLNYFFLNASGILLIIVISQPKPTAQLSQWSKGFIVAVLVSC